MFVEISSMVVYVRTKMLVLEDMLMKNSAKMEAHAEILLKVEVLNVCAALVSMDNDVRCTIHVLKVFVKMKPNVLILQKVLIGVFVDPLFMENSVSFSTVVTQLPVKMDAVYHNQTENIYVNVIQISMVQNASTKILVHKDLIPVKEIH